MPSSSHCHHRPRRCGAGAVRRSAKPQDNTQPPVRHRPFGPQEAGRQDEGCGAHQRRVYRK